MAVNNYFSSLEGEQGAVATAEGEAQEGTDAGGAVEAPAEGEAQQEAATAGETEPASGEQMASQAEGGEEETSAEPKE